MERSRRKSSYHISFETFALQPILDGATRSTLVIERSRKFIIPKSSAQIVMNSCDYYGETFHNATIASKNILGKRHKTPIIIAHNFKRPFIILPTMSHSSSQNEWIALHAIENIKPNKMGCIIYLENDQDIQVNVSATTIYRQYTFACFLHKDFLKKQESINRKSLLFPYSGF
ncbi:competence protein ComK [Sporosarcina sp. FA9]|uniref:competence protein ComK n=1 Tax=Sporosarcina sp. FA9 TaxID=3413030 RepID=UPI003F659907